MHYSMGCAGIMMYTHLVDASTICTCVLCEHLQLLLAFSRDISRLRARYISMLPRGSTSHTVLVTGAAQQRQ
jgi:hypothetical protein